MRLSRSFLSLFLLVLLQPSTLFASPLPDQKHELFSLADSEIQDSWTYSMEQPVPNPQFAFDAWMRIDSPATDDFPIQQGERYVTYNNQENLGGYEAALVMKKSGTDERYRVMFSTQWKEILVWSSRGGILAVKPYPFNVGQTYRVLFAIRGQELMVYVNNQKIIDFFDRTVPIQPDTLGVATKEGSTYFGPLRIWGIGTPYSPPPHQPNFSIRTWKGIDWGFDGDEPIFALPWKRGMAALAMATEVKLVPGYSAQLTLPWYLQNWVDEFFRTDKITELKRQKEGDELQFTLTTVDDRWRKDLINRTKITVRYLANQNIYQYDHESELEIPTGSTLRVSAAIDVVDPLFHQIVPSASPQGKQWPVAHQWNVYQQLNGTYYKQPINHFSWYPGFGSPAWWNASMHYMKPNNGSWTVVGDPVSSPVLEWLESPTRKEFSALMCWWGYDLHLNWFPGDGSPTVLNPGIYKMNWRLTSLPATDANARLASASYAFPGDLTEKWLVYTGGVGHIEKFDKTVLKASPFGEFIWGESTYQDTTIGKDDGKSLRLDGPDFLLTTAGESQFTEAFEPNTDYEISAWVKTENVQGEGPGIVFSGQPYYPGIQGTKDWQRIGFVARPQEPLHTVGFSLHSSGSGKTWFDNFLIRPITPGNPVAPGLNNPPKPLTTVSSPDPDKLLLFNPSGAVSDSAQTVLDLSGHGHHARREGVTLETEMGKNLFQFSGNNSQIFIPGHESVNFPKPNSLIVWFKPGNGRNGWNVLISGGPRESDRWRVILVKTHFYYLVANVAGYTIGGPSYPVQANQWSQLVLVNDDSQISIYLNGQLIETKPSSTSYLGSGTKGYLRLGSMAYNSLPAESFEGRVSQLKILSKALNPAEVMTEFGKGPFSP